MRGFSIYIAGSFDGRTRLKTIRDAIHARTPQHTVLSTWLDDETGEGRPPSDLAQTYARRDYSEIRRADLLLLDTFDDDPRGGREVELGFARGLGLKAFRVGPARNIFHALLPAFGDWEAMYDALGADKDA